METIHLAKKGKQEEADFNDKIILINYKNQKAEEEQQR